MKTRKKNTVTYGNGHALKQTDIESAHDRVLPELDKLSLKLAELARLLQNKDTSDVVTNLKNGALTRIKKAKEAFNGEVEVHEPNSYSKRGCQCRRTADKG